MIIDCHQHYSPDLFPVSRLISEMDRSGVDKTALMASICGNIKEPAAPVLAALRFSLRRHYLRIIPEKIITRFTENGDVILPSGVVEIIKSPDNDVVFNLSEQYPDRFFAWCFVNPKSGLPPLEEYEKRRNHPAFVGVKAHPFWHRYGLKELIPVCERLSKDKKPLIIHNSFDNHKDLLEIADSLPDLVIIIAHAGFPFYDDTWKVVKSRKNIYVDFSATAYVNTSIMKDASSSLGVERCLFGTDAPFGSHGKNNCFDMNVIKKRIETVFTDKAHQRMITGENFINIISR